SEAERKEAASRAALEEARAAMARESAKETPDFDPVERALNAVVAQGGATAIEAKSELRALALLRQSKVLEADLKRERQRRAEEAIQAQQDVLTRSKEQAPLGSVFATRGVIERRTGTDGISRFYLRYGGQTTCELACSSGRYDLSTFAGTLVGVHGNEIASR